MAMNSKGQVTIPKDIQERLGLEPGDEVEFKPNGDGVVMTKTSKIERQQPKTEEARILAWAESVSGTLDDYASTEEFMSELRDRDIPLS